MRRLMARIGELFRDTAIYWQDGVQLKPSSPRAVAEVVCHHNLDNNPAHGEIVLTVWGDGHQEPLNRLRNEFDRLHGSEREIDESASLDGTRWVSLADLKRFDQIGHLETETGEQLSLQPFRFLLHLNPDQRLDEIVPPPSSRKPSTMTNPLPAIYISYAWGDAREVGPESREDIVDRLYDSLLADGYDVRRDKHDLAYKGSLSEFMQEIGRGACIVIVISDKSLRSPNCMFELLEIHRHQQFRERICPIVLSDAKIHSLASRLEYVAHWKTEYQRLEKVVKKVGIDVLSSEGSFKEYEKIRDIAQNADKLVTILGDMNSSTPRKIEADDFDMLKQAIDERLRQVATLAGGP